MMEARAMSYLSMIGMTPEAINVCETRGFELELIKWYDFDAITLAIADKYNMSEYEVINNYLKLIEMLK